MKRATVIALLAFVHLPLELCGARAASVNREKTIVALGTSLTKDGGWTEDLERSLSQCAAGTVQVINLGGSGKTSEWGREQIARVVSAKPDLLLVEFAINDAHLMKGVSRARAEDNIRSIVATVRSSVPNASVILLSMNPVHGLRGWMRLRYNMFNDDYGVLAKELRARSVDLRPVWLASGLDLSAAIPDGVHPTRQAVRTTVLEVLRDVVRGEC